MNAITFKAYAACLGFTTIFCIHYIVAKEVLQSISPVALGASRGIAGGLLICGSVPHLFRGIPWRTLLVAIPVGVLGFCINQLLFLHGLNLSHASTAAVLSNLIPLASTLLAIAFGIEVYSHRRLAGLLIGFIAVGAFILWDVLDNIRVAWGNLLIVLSVFSLASALVLAKRYLRDLPSPVLSGLMLLTGGVILLAMEPSGLSEAWEYTWESDRTSRLMLFEVVVSTALAYSLNLYAMKHLLVSRTMVFAYLQPIITAGLVFVLFDQVPPDGLWLLFPVVVGAVALTTAKT